MRKQTHEKAETVPKNPRFHMEREETKTTMTPQKRKNLQGFLDEVPDRFYLGLVRIQELSRNGEIENRKATFAIQEALGLEGYPSQAVRRLTGIFSHRGYIEKIIKSGMLKGYRITELGKQIISREATPESGKTRPSTGRQRMLRTPNLTEDDFRGLMEKAKSFEESSRKMREYEKELALIKKKREKLTARRDNITAQLNELLSKQAGILEESQKLRKLVSQSALAAEKLREIQDIIR